MKKTAQKKSYTIYAFQYPIFILLATLFVGALHVSKTLSSQNTRSSHGYYEGDVLGKEKGQEKGVGNVNKPEKNADKSENKGNKPFDKPTPGTGSPNAALHKNKVLKVVDKLNEVSDEEEEIGNEETSEEIEEVANDEEENVDEVAEAIEAVETRPKWKTLLFGSDYKNLGQLRSHLAHNTNAIRKLTRAKNEVQAEGNEEDVQAQLGELIQERERIRNVITEYEDDFGILGWVFRFLNGYMGGGLDDDIGDYVDVPESTESTESTL
jgi:hypothetical protein